MGDVAALAEGVEGGAGRGGAARDQPRRPEGIDGGDGAATVCLGDGQGAFVEAVRPRPRVGLLPRPQVVFLLAEECDNV